MHLVRMDRAKLNPVKTSPVSMNLAKMNLPRINLVQFCPVKLSRYILPSSSPLQFNNAHGRHPGFWRIDWQARSPLTDL
jgi:hypothetical protein